MHSRWGVANGHSVPIIAGGCTIDSLDGARNLNLQTGFVGNNEVRVLRDTGCESAAVGKDLNNIWCLKIRCLTKGLSC